MALISSLFRRIKAIILWSADGNKDLLPLPDIRALLPDIQGGAPNLLPRSAWLAPLRVEFQMWQNSDPSEEQPEHLCLYWNNALVEKKTWTQAVVPADLFIMVPQSTLIEGEHRLYYRVMTSNEVDTESLVLTLNIDKTPPMLENEGTLIFPAEVTSGGVTERYLKDHDEQLSCEVPAYLVPVPGDVITWYWSASPTGSEVAGSSTLEQVDLDKPLMLNFRGQLIRDSGDGPRYASYKIEDRSGNAGSRAQPVELQVAAQPVPRDLPPPKVKEASGSGSSSTLNPANAFSGVTVVIQDAAVINPGETVFVQWSEPDGTGAYRAEVAVASGSRECRIPSTRIAQHFNTSMPVYYEVLENGSDPPHVSQEHTLRVSGMSNFPTVQCDKVSANQLSLSGIPNGGHASFTLESWSFMATDQFINIKVDGTDSASQGVTVEVLKAFQVPEVADRINVGRISKTDLQRFKIGGGLTVKVEVSFDGRISWQPFPRLTPILVN